MAEEKEDKIRDFQEKYRIAEDGESDYATQRKEDKAFYWDDQWDAEVKAGLEDEGRPALTYNEIKPTVNFVSGSQRQNRLDFKVLNRVGGSDQVAQILTVLIKDIENQSNAEFENSDMFLDGLIAGRGFLSITVEYDKDIVNGDIVIKRKASDRVKIDPGFEEYDLSDASYIFEEGWYTKKQLKLIYPEKAGEIDMLVVQPSDTQRIVGTTTEDYDRSGKQSSISRDLNKYRLKVKTCWYKVYERTKWRFCEETGDLARIDDKMDTATLDQWLAFQQRRGLTWRIIENVVLPVLNLGVFVGNLLLHEKERPYGEMNKYPIIPYFAYKLDEKNQGMITSLKDPQREVNKRSSQFLHLINTAANSGWMIEDGSVPDLNEYKNQGAKSGFIARFKRGRTPPQKLVPSPPSQGHLIAEQKGSDKIKKISGVNPDLLGERATRGEAGVVIQARQRQGNIVIEQLYDNWRRTRKLAGQLLVDMIQKARTYTAEEIINIVGRDEILSKKNPNILNDIERVMSDLDVGRYEIKVDMQTSTPTIRQANYDRLIEAAKAGIDIPSDILVEAHPDLPNKDEILEKLRQRMAQQEQMLQLQMQQAGTPGSERPGRIRPPGR